MKRNAVCRFLRHVVPVFAALALVLLLPALAMACPTCKDGLAENDPAANTLIRGYFWSILFMMAMPFLIFAGLSSYFYLEVRRARTRAAKALLSDSSPFAPEAARPA